MKQLLKFFKILFNSSLIKNSGIYTIISGLNASIPFLILPFITRVLSPTDVGIVFIFTMTISFLNPLINVSVQDAIVVNYYKFEAKKFPLYVGNCINIIFSSSILFTLIFIFFKSQIIDITAVEGNWIFALIIFCFFQSVSSILLSIWQVENKIFKYGFFQISQTLLNFSLTFFLISVVGLKWEGRLIAHVGTISLFGVVGFYFLFKNKIIKINLDIKYVKDVLKYALPLIPHQLGALVLSMTDRFLISKMLGMEETGYYTVAFQIACLMLLFTSSVNKAYVPWLYSNLKKDDARTNIKIVKIIYAYFALLLLIFAIGSLFLPIFMQVYLGKDFNLSANFVFWLLLVFIIDGMYLMVTNFIFYSEKTHLLSAITVFIFIINIPLTYIFIKWNGAVGAAQATSISFFVFFIMTWWVSSKIHKMPWLFFLKKREPIPVK